MSQIMTIPNADKNLLMFCEMIDSQKWGIKELSVRGLFDSQALSEAIKTLKCIQSEFETVKPCIPSERSYLSQYVEKKLKCFTDKLVTFQPIAPIITHSQFANAITIPSESSSHKQDAHLLKDRNNDTLRIIQPLSFTIESPSGQPDLSVLQILDRVSFLLRNEDEKQALDEFSSLPDPIQQLVYEALWIVRGKPIGNHPIAHPNFGEMSFKNIEVKSSSTPQQKACAIELAKISAALLAIIAAFENKDQLSANQIFNDLPSHIRNEIFKKHWEEMGKPTDQSPEESLKRIAHSDFGQVSLLGLDPRCDVSFDKKKSTLENYLLSYRKKMEELQDIIYKKQAEWTLIDRSSTPGPTKNSAKKDSLNDLANLLIPQFLGKVSLIHPIPKGASFQSLAEAYIGAYPCLRLSILQMIPNLIISGEIPPEAKFSMIAPYFQLPVPDFVNMSDQEQREYRINIMNNTLATLRKGYYINSKKEKVVLHLQPSVNSLCYISEGGKLPREARYRNSIIYLNKEDCLTTVCRCIKHGLSPFVLIAGSEEKFGGGYQTGAMAQEEEITRRSTLCIPVDVTQKVQSQNFYPLDRPENTHGCLYVSNIAIFRGKEQEGYPYLDEPFETAAGIATACNFNEEHRKKKDARADFIKKLTIDPTTNELRIPNSEALETKEKLRTILHAAQEKGHNAVVLIPFGCGAFCNPPKHVCEIIMGLITEEFPYSFQEIHISIIDDHNTGKSHNPRGNYVEFEETIKQFQSQGLLDKINAKLIVT